MEKSKTSPRRSHETHWGGLYLFAAVMIVLLFVQQVVLHSAAAHELAEALIWLLLFGGIAVWVHFNLR